MTGSGHGPHTFAVSGWTPDGAVEQAIYHLARQMPEMLSAVAAVGEARRAVLYGTTKSAQREAASRDIEPVTSRKFSEEEADRILGVLAEEHGNSTTAAPRLKELGFDIDESSLRRWRTKYPNRYRAIQFSLTRKEHSNGS